MTRFWMAMTLAVALAGPAAAKTLRIGAQADAGTMDPQAQNIQTTVTLLSMIYEPLVTRDRTLAKVPGLAESWTRPGPTTWRFKLRPGVQFSDGAALTADDVVFTIGRAQAQTSQFSAYVAGLKATAPDPATVEIETPAPDPLLADKLIYIPIMRRAWAEAHNALTPQNLRDPAESYTALHADGTGPYVLASRAPDSKTVLTRNPHYWGKTDGDIDEVDFLPIGNDPTRVAALISGEIDLLLDVPSQDVARLAANPDLKIDKTDEFRTIFFGFDLKSPMLKYADAGARNPFQDLRVRQAMNMAIDRDAIVRTVMRGLASSTAQILAPGNVGYDKALDKGPARNIAEAKKLLTEAGYPDGFAVTLDCPNDRYINDEQVCRTVATMLAQAGVRVTLNAMPRAKYFPKVWANDTSFFLIGFNSPYFDGMYALETMLMTRNDAKGEGIYNYEGLSDPALDTSIAAARSEPDPDKRAALMKTVYKTITDDVDFIALYNQVVVYAMRKTVTAPVRPDNWLDIRTVTMN